MVWVLPSVDRGTRPSIDSWTRCLAFREIKKKRRLYSRNFPHCLGPSQPNLRRRTISIDQCYVTPSCIHTYVTLPPADRQTSKPAHPFISSLRMRSPPHTGIRWYRNGNVLTLRKKPKMKEEEQGKEKEKYRAMSRATNARTRRVQTNQSYFTS